MTRLYEFPESRARLYGLLAQAFRFPDKQAIDNLGRGNWTAEVRANIATLGLSNGIEDLAHSGVCRDDYEVEFIRLFEVGMNGAPCPLHSGYYSRDRMRDLEEVVRFYRFFGYEPMRTSDRFPDHLAFELEFMAHLARKELHDSENLGSLRLAQRDFCQRHLANWTPNLREAVERRAVIPFITNVVRLTDMLVAEDSLCLEDAVQALNA